MTNFEKTFLMFTIAGTILLIGWIYLIVYIIIELVRIVQ